MALDDKEKAAGKSASIDESTETADLEDSKETADLSAEQEEAEKRRTARATAGSDRRGGGGGGGGGGSDGGNSGGGGRNPLIASLVAYGPTVGALTGLVLIFLGQYPFANIDAARVFLTTVGTIGLLGAVAIRAWTFMTSQGRQRGVEFILLLSYAGVVASLLVYFLTTDSGTKLLGIADREAARKFATAANVLWVIMMAISLTPLLMVELTIGFANRFAAVMDRSGRGASVETHRVREAATSGLTIALAAAFLMVTCNVADQRNVQVDLSYFKTSSPGESSQNIVKSLVDQDLTVLLFFADVSEVADEVHAYFDALQQASGNVVIERYDPIAASGAAKEHKVSKEGTIVFKLGDKTEKLNINPDIEKARRNELRELDKKVQQALMKVVREKKTACLSVGHGELNQSTTQRPNVLGIPGTGIDKATQLRGWLRFLNYEVQDYKSFGQPVPKNCTVLIVLSPLVPLSDETSRAIDDFLADGGSLLYVLDPIGQATLGPILEPRLGVKYEPAPLADDKLFRPIRRNQSDHQYVATTEFTAHASVTTASRAGAGVGLVFLRSGSLSDVPFQDEGTTRSYPIKSMSTTWQELSQPPNWTYDGSEEQRRQRNIMAAIQGPTVGGAPNTGFRAIVLADAELFSDLVLKRDQFQATLPQMIVLDAIRWLGGEEALIGDVQDEKDVPIEHTRNEDVVWFYTTILGFPILVLGLGLVWVTISRRRSGRRRAS